MAFLGAAAWPVVAYLIARMFREEISRKIRSLTSAKGFGLDATFAEALDNISDATNAPTAGPYRPASAGSASERIDFIDDYGPLARKTSPQSKVIDRSFKDLVAALREFSGPHGQTKDGRNRYVSTMLDKLLDANAIPEDMAKRVSALKSLRNLAISDPDSVSPEQAEHFEKVAAILRDHFVAQKPLK